MGPRNLLVAVRKAFGRSFGLVVVLKRNGLVHSLRLLYVCFLVPWMMKALRAYLRLYGKGRSFIEKHYGADRVIRYLRQNREELVRRGKSGYQTPIEDLQLSTEGLYRLRKALDGSADVVIADIDQDGFLRPCFGSISNAPCVSAEQFLPRKRYKLTLVAVDGHVGVKKDYKGDKLSFAYEAKALEEYARAGCNVPSIMDIDCGELTLTFSYIRGRVLREELASKGAVLNDRDVDNDPKFAALGPREKWLWCLHEGKRVLYNVIDSEFAEDVFEERRKMHECGYILQDMKYGNVVREQESGKPYLLDFENSRRCPYIGRAGFRALRDRDIDAFNLHFDAHKLTHMRVRYEIERTKDSDIYAPVYFGGGLRLGRIWDISAGYGRWHYILKRHLLPVSGMRILDLGAKDGFNSIQLLRNGAREAVGIELDSRYIAQGRFVHAALEWADNTHYNFRYIPARIEDVCEMNLGTFDMVLGLCSLYYLDDESCRSVMAHVASIADLCVLQCNVRTDIGRLDVDVHRRASIGYAVNALKNSGFPIARVIAPRGYSRPLVIGRKDKF